MTVRRLRLPCSLQRRFFDDLSVLRVVRASTPTTTTHPPHPKQAVCVAQTRWQRGVRGDISGANNLLYASFSGRALSYEQDPYIPGGFLKKPARSNALF